MRGIGGAPLPAASAANAQARAGAGPGVCLRPLGTVGAVLVPHGALARGLEQLRALGYREEATAE